MNPSTSSRLLLRLIRGQTPLVTSDTAALLQVKKLLRWGKFPNKKWSISQPQTSAVVVLCSLRILPQGSNYLQVLFHLLIEPAFISNSSFLQPHISSPEICASNKPSKTFDTQVSAPLYSNWTRIAFPSLL